MNEEDIIIKKDQNSGTFGNEGGSVYLYEKLETVCSAQFGSSSAILAGFFLNENRKHHNCGIKSVCLETALSKSSVVRFCQSAGFEGYFELMDTLASELETFENQLRREKLPQPHHAELIQADW